MSDGQWALGGLAAFAAWLFVILPFYHGWFGRSEIRHPQQSRTETAQSANTEPKGSRQAPFFVQVLPGPDAAKKAADEAEDREEKKHADRWLVRWTMALAFATIGLIIATSVLGFFAYRQARDMRDSIAVAKESTDAAKKAANAAERSANAAVEAERGRIYLVIESDNLHEILRGPRLYDNSPEMNESPVTPPRLKYRLKNFGKTPAILKSVSHGMVLKTNRDNGMRELEPLIDRPLEILGASEPTDDLIECGLDHVFRFGQARDVVTGDSELLAYGEVVFVDGFNQERTLSWKASGTDTGFRLFRYDEGTKDT